MFKNQIHKNQKEVKIQMPINQNRRKEMCLIHTMEYYLAIKSKDGLIHTTSWMKSQKHYIEQSINKPNVSLHAV